MKKGASALPLWVAAAYAAPAFGQALIHGPAGNMVQAIYAKDFGLAMTSIAGVLLVVRLFDAAIDPMIGYASDRFRVRFGSRKPWIVVGSAIAVVACWFLYVPAQPVTIEYFLFFFVLAFLGWTISEIPYTAWLAEITDDYNERTRLASWRAVLIYLGTMAFFAIPLLPFLGTTEFTPKTLLWSAVLASIVFPITVALAVLFVPDGKPPAAHQRQSVAATWSAVAKNGPFLNLMAMFFVSSLGSGISFSLLYFYFDNHMHQAAAFAGLFTLTIPIGAAAVPVWAYLCRILGKQRAWALATVLGAATLASFAFLDPAHTTPTTLAIVLFVLIAVFACYVVAPMSMLADVVDYGRWRFRADHAGTYFSVYALATKAAAGVGGALGFAIPPLFGFDPKLAQQTEMGTTGLLLAFSILPAALNLITLPLIWSFPITERRQRAIVRRLERRQARAGAGA